MLMVACVSRWHIGARFSVSSYPVFVSCLICLHPTAQPWIGRSESVHLISAHSVRRRAWMVRVRCFDGDDLAVGLRGAQPSPCSVGLGYGLTFGRSVWYREGAVGILQAVLRARDAVDDWADATSLARYWQQVIYIQSIVVLVRYLPYVVRLQLLFVVNSSVCMWPVRYC